MRVVIVGGGVIGISTAYWMREYGADVTIIERRSAVGEETSARNGSLLHPSLAEPWNSPGIFRTMISNFGREDSAMLLRLGALPSMIGWGLRFVRESSPDRFKANALRNMRLAVNSTHELARIRAATNINFHWYKRGTLTVFRERKALDEARRWYESLAGVGISVETLDPAGVLAVEPTLADVVTHLVGAIHAGNDEAGDPQAYSRELAGWLVKAGVQLRLNQSVNRIKRRAGRIDGFELASGECVTADHYILAAGSYTVPLAESTGIRLPVRPVKGYSLTLPRISDAVAPWTPVADAAMHMAVIPVGSDRIRVAGTAEFCGFDTAPNPSRAANLLSLLGGIFPQFASRVKGLDTQPWNGLRAVSADGVPLIGPTQHPNLWVNTGQGHAGWTLAAASGRLLADLICGQQTAVSEADYTPLRFN